jgi:hypothetical protein
MVATEKSKKSEFFASFDDGRRVGTGGGITFRSFTQVVLPSTNHGHETCLSSSARHIFGSH